FASVNAAISPSVRPVDFRRKAGSLILQLDTLYDQLLPGSKLGAAAETENLRAVANFVTSRRGRAIFCKRVSQIEAQRSERRIPDQADTDRRSDHRRTVEADLQRFAGYVPKGWSLVVPQRAGIGKGRNFYADIFRQEV